MQTKIQAKILQDIFKFEKADGAYAEVYNPATQELIGKVRAFDELILEDAIELSEQAQKQWQALSANNRSKILRRWADLVLEHKKDLALILTSEQGKPLKEAEGEVIYGASFITWFGEEAKRVYGDIIPAPVKNQRIITLKQPVGVTAAITPWNFPNAMITRKVAPALAVGCSMLVKPASATPFSALALEALALEAGIPKGVFQVVSCDSKNSHKIGELLATSAKIRKLSFTGSTFVGARLMQLCAPSIKKLSLELGGNAPFIVFDDADIDKAVAGAVAAKFRNSGQTCICANRFFAQEKIYDEFCEKFAKASSTLKVGNGLDETTTTGPLINQSAVDKAKNLLDDAIDKGASLQGDSPFLGGNFVAPRIITGVNSDMEIFKQEIFAPLAPIFKFSTTEEVIESANNTKFGLAAYFYANDLSKVWQVAEALEYGMVGINTGAISNEVAPFGGIKSSGIGREGSKYGIDEYVEIKYLCMDIS